jgi:outer membrane biosynthesis protein TonB
VKPTLTALVQPQLVPPKKEEPKSEPDDDDPAQAFAGGTKGGTAGGTIGGTIGGKLGGRTGGTAGGAVGGTGPKPMGPRKLAPQIGALQKESGDDPDFPALLRRPGRFYVVLANICVSRTGSVDGVTILQGADTLLDGNVVSAVKKWRYRPLMADNQAVPFCYFGRFEFKSN